MKLSLLDQLGGAEQLGPLIELHNNKVLNDKRVSHFFVGVDISALSHKQKSFLQLAFGQSSGVTADLNYAHARLRSIGMDDSHVDAIFELFAESLREFGAGPEQVNAAIARLEEWRDIVMGRASHSNSSV